MRGLEGGSNALLVSGRESQGGNPVAVFGPQTSYFAPQLLIEQDAHAPSGPEGPGDRRARRLLHRHQPLRAAGARSGLLLERDIRRPGHHRHLRDQALRSGWRPGDRLRRLSLERRLRADRGDQEDQRLGPERRRPDPSRLRDPAGVSHQGRPDHPPGRHPGPALRVHASCAPPTSTRSTRRARSPTGTARTRPPAPRTSTPAPSRTTSPSTGSTPTTTRSRTSTPAPTRNARPTPRLTSR